MRGAGYFTQQMWTMNIWWGRFWLKLPFYLARILQLWCHRFRSEQSLLQSSDLSFLLRPWILDSQPWDPDMNTLRAQLQMPGNLSQKVLTLTMQRRLSHLHWGFSKWCVGKHTYKGTGTMQSGPRSVFLMAMSDSHDCNTGQHFAEKFPEWIYNLLFPSFKDNVQCLWV